MSNLYYDDLVTVNYLFKLLGKVTFYYYKNKSILSFSKQMRHSIVRLLGESSNELQHLGYFLVLFNRCPFAQEHESTFYMDACKYNRCERILNIPLSNKV